MARKKDPMKEAMSDYFRKIGAKGGKKRGDDWAAMSPEERKQKMAKVTAARLAKRTKQE